MVEFGPQNETYPGLAYDQVLANMGGNTELLTRLAQVFLQQHAHDHARIMAALRARDRRQAIFLAHGLRGTAASLGGMDVHDAAHQLECLLKDGGDPCGPSLTHLQTTLAAFNRTLRHLIAATNAG